MTELGPISLSSLIESGEVPKTSTRLSDDEKKRLAEHGTPFVITEIEYGDDAEYGPFWQVTIALDGETTMFNMGSNPRRDPFMEKLQSVVGRQPISGVRLNAVPTRRGKPFFMIEPVS